MPNKYLKKAHHLILLHGRHICKSKNPLCTKCIINKISAYIKIKMSKKILGIGNAIVDVFRKS